MNMFTSTEVRIKVMENKSRNQKKKQMSILISVFQVTIVWEFIWTCSHWHQYRRQNNHKFPSSKHMLRILGWQINYHTTLVFQSTSHLVTSIAYQFHRIPFPLSLMLFITFSVIHNARAKKLILYVSTFPTSYV